MVLGLEKLKVELIKLFLFNLQVFIFRFVNFGINQKIVNILVKNRSLWKVSIFIIFQNLIFVVVVRCINYFYIHISQIFHIFQL